MSNNLVIVESPAKAKTINKYLGSDYTVLASYGHVRDLVNKDGSVKPDDDFSMLWELGDRAGKTLSDIKKAIKKADTLYLAPDPDREGEAIAWHVKELLNESKLLKGKKVHRVTFNQITKKAVQEAFAHTRELDQPLIEAYLARRALDYLVGFNLSPVLWRKLPGSRSAGRVQSVALRLICEREAEIEKFEAQEYWSIEAQVHTDSSKAFLARLTHLQDEKLGKMGISSEAEAKKAVSAIEKSSLLIKNIEKKQVKRTPSPPFITSTMQMEAARKLGYSASQTMRLAQQLYEGVDIGGETVGLITYMRTDGITLSEEAVAQARTLIAETYGKEYVPEKPRIYKSKAKNAQEAHEAIRPTDLSKKPESIKRYLDDKQAALYDLIWKRTMASEMDNALLEQMAVDIVDKAGKTTLRANGSNVVFDGFLKIYHEDKDDEEYVDEKDTRLPPLKEQESILLDTVTPNQHFTQPPPRFSEASLVKVLEELGIGRPSTYASILQVLRDRKYVVLEKKRFTPEDRGLLVTTFLTSFFEKYVDYDFTANLEEQLDSIAAGDINWKETLHAFWKDFSAAIEQTKELTITNVIDHLNDALGHHFFPPKADGSPPRDCPACSENKKKDKNVEIGELSLKLGKFGAFVGCSNYPDCRFTRPLIVPEGEDGTDGAALSNEPKELGKDPDSGRTVTLRRGPYGPYVQIDPPPETAEEKAAWEAVLKEQEDKYLARVKKAEEKGKEPPKKPKPKKKPVAKPKRQGIPKDIPLADVDLKMALKLLSLPRDVGHHPETGLMIQAGIGRFGPFLKHNDKFKSIPKDDDVLTIGMNRAVELLAQPSKKRASKKSAKKSEKKTAKKSASSKKTSTKKKSSSKKSASKKKKSS